MSRGRLARRVSLASLVTVAALMAAPSGAGAATQIGETFAPQSNDPHWCGRNTTRLQLDYAVPFDGVITQWNFQADTDDDNVSPMKFKVARPAGGNDFTLIGESAVVLPAPGTLNSYFIRIRVQANDIIGTYTAETMLLGYCRRAQAGFSEFWKSGDLVPPTMTTLNGPEAYQLDVSANLEPDCDNDGLGDETQDTNLSSCAPGTTPSGTTPPPGTGPAPTLPSGEPATCKGKPATIVGTGGNDVRTGSQGPDVILGLGGNDTLSGIAGNDVICGDAGKDTLKGGKGKDTLLGQKGKDKLKGGGGKDLCKGGKGNDTASKCEIEKSI